MKLQVQPQTWLRSTTARPRSKGQDLEKPLEAGRGHLPSPLKGCALHSLQGLSPGPVGQRTGTLRASGGSGGVAESPNLSPEWERLWAAPRVSTNRRAHGGYTQAHSREGAGDAHGGKET